MQGISFYSFVNIYPFKSLRKLILLICCEQVVAVTVLVLERKTVNSYAETKVDAKGFFLDIPLAGFLLGMLFALLGSVESLYMSRMYLL